MAKKNLNSFGTKTEITIGGKKFFYHSLPALEKKLGKDLSRLPFSIKILIENLMRQEDGTIVKKDDIENLVAWNHKKASDREIQFMPARTILQDFTGVPAVADFAAMRGAVKRLGGDPNRINPLRPAELVIDHSVQVDYFGTADAFDKNVELEFERNKERYEFLRWGQTALKNFRVVPPDTGIVHQVNLEHLAQVAMTGEMDGAQWVYPDTLVGTDSHTTMINGLGVLGWGVGGIEAEAGMLGQPSSMLIPEVVGFKMKGALPAGTTATDLVLTATQMLRKKGVVNKFVEFFGPGLKSLTLADRATLANMAPEYGATCGLFPVDEQTVAYLKLTGREEYAERAEAYYKAQKLWFDDKTPDANYSDVLELDLATVEPSLAGPSRPQDRVGLGKLSEGFQKDLPTLVKDNFNAEAKSSVSGEKYELEHGSVVIAAITSCTNTSNPSLLLAAGLLAKKATERGMKVKPWVKTSLAPGSRVVESYLKESGLLGYLEKLKFHIVGYGCTTCIGNSGPLPEPIAQSVVNGKLCVASVLSGNRNFEGRINPHVRANYLASPPLVVAYALAGNVKINLTKDPIGKDSSGKDVFLKDIWPTPKEVADLVQKHINSAMFSKGYTDVFKGPKEWQNLKYPSGDLYKWDSKSTYIKEPPFFSTMAMDPKPIQDIKGGRLLAMLKDSVTTDHISPAGDISGKSPAGEYLKNLGVDKKDFNSYGARRGNHEIMMRGTFANVRLKNFLAPGTEGGVTRYHPDDKEMSIYDASMKYQEKGTPLLVFAGKEYGTGSSRDWAAKGTLLLGVKAVIAGSFERIHRTNLVCMGVLPLQFKEGESWESLGITGKETFDLTGLDKVSPGQTLKVNGTTPDGKKVSFEVRVRIDTPNELEYYKHGGILPFVLRQIVKGQA